jgi:hypothetical protein
MEWADGRRMMNEIVAKPTATVHHTDKKTVGSPLFAVLLVAAQGNESADLHKCKGGRPRMPCLC